MYLFSLMDTIANKLDLSVDIKTMSIIDLINFELKKDQIQKIMKQYNNPTEIEKYVIKIYTDKYIDVKNLLSQNYFNNILADVYFIIGNPFSIDTDNFNLIYENLHLFKLLDQMIIDCYEKIINHPIYYKFYNIDMINRWQKTVICLQVSKEEYYGTSKLKPIEKEAQWLRYQRVFSEFNKRCKVLQKYLFRLEQFYKTKQINTVGCYNISKQLYLKCVESHTGINIDIPKLESWAIKELDRLINSMKEQFKIIDPSINVDDEYIKILSKLIEKSNQKYENKKEFVIHHRKIMSKYKDFFVNKLEFKQFSELRLMAFDNKYLGGGYYFENIFYLNIHNWKKMHKYSTESLVLHEGYPGHHLQLNGIKYLNQENNLLFSYFNSIVNGFIEGWGLFSENLGFKQTTWDKVGHIEYEILRTLRIIVDIRIHHKGYTPHQVFLYMKKYLAIPDEGIKSEVYRYVCMPGQAISYKVGAEVFKRIFESHLTYMNSIYSTDRPGYLHPVAIQLYKKLINEGPIPLNFLMKKYKINEDDLFKC